MVENERFHVIMNVTHGCNLACSYCYYSEQMATNPGNMDIATVERVFEQISKSSASTIDLSIHGGEPLLKDWKYYGNFFKLQKELLGDRKINNSFQTNGTLIDEAFIKKYLEVVSEEVNLGMGISLDGPMEVHDKYRVYKKGRKGSFKDIMKNIELLEKYNLNIAILAVPSLTMPEYFPELYKFFKSIKNLHFLDILVPKYNTFQNFKKESLSIMYTQIFDSWFFDKDAHFDIRFFYSVVLSFLTGKGSMCIFQNDCIVNNKMININPDGDVSFCDSFPEVKLGNIWKDDFDSLVDKNNKVRRVLSFKEEERIEKCLFCKWYKICNGGCPANYLPGSNQSNYFCEEYKKIFSHIDNRLNEVDISSKKRLSDDNLEKFINPRLKKYLHKLKVQKTKKRI